MSNRFDVIVIGVGAMGSAACRQLARRGVRVLGIDRYAIPNAMGSSHGQSRMIRQAYYEHPDYVPLLIRAYELWRELESDSGERILHVTGGIYTGPARNELVDGALASAEKHGVPFEMLSAAQLRSRYDQFHLPDEWKVLWEPRAGFLVPELAINTFAKHAARYGAELHAQEALLDCRFEATGVVVRTDRDQYRADKVIFCAGPWSGRIIADLNIPLTPTRHVLNWVRPRLPDRFSIGHLPVFAIDRADGFFYGFPITDANSGFKVALHKGGPAVDPETVDRAIHPADSAWIMGCIRDHLPEAQGDLIDSHVCMYTNSPDLHFIVGPHPKQARAIVACGFSGHGFKFASVIGEALADLAVTGKTDLPIDFLSPRRFA